MDPLGFHSAFSNLYSFLQPTNSNPVPINRTNSSIDNLRRKVTYINEKLIDGKHQDINDICKHNIEELNQLKHIKTELKNRVKYIHRNTSGLKGFFNLLFKPEKQTELKQQEVEIKNLITYIKKTETKLKGSLEKEEKTIESRINELKFKLIKERFEEIREDAMQENLDKEQIIMRTQQDPLLQKLRAELESLEAKQEQIIDKLGTKRERLISRLMDDPSFKKDFNNMLHQVVGDKSRPLEDRLKGYQESLIQICSDYIKHKKVEAVDIETEEMQIVIEAGLKAIRQDNFIELEKIYHEILKLNEEKEGLDALSQWYLSTLEPIVLAVRDYKV